MNDEKKGGGPRVDVKRLMLHMSLLDAQRNHSA